MDASFLHVDTEVAQAELSLCWAHISEGPFSHGVAYV